MNVWWFEGCFLFVCQESTFFIYEKIHRAVYKKGNYLFFFVVKQFVHVLHLKDEEYLDSFNDVRQKRFKATKLSIEHEV